MCEFVCELLRMGSQEGLYEGTDKGTLGVIIKEKHLLHPFLGKEILGAALSDNK